MVHSSASIDRSVASGSNCAAGSRSKLIRAVAGEAWGYYSDAVKVLTERQRYSSDELRELETKIVQICYSQNAYGCGRQSLRRRLAYDTVNQAPSVTRMESLLQLADWEVLASHARRNRVGYEAVLDAYQEAYATLASDDAGRASVEALFAPEIPVVLPTFAPNPLVSRPTSSSSGGYIDVAFDVTKYGRAEHVDILDTTTNAPREAKKALVSTIFRSAFRPRVVDGHVADAARVVVRYYVD